MPFSFKRLKLDGTYILEPRVFADQRGYFMETFAEKAFKETGLQFKVVQENYSHSVYGVLRGLHFQKGEWSQAKLVRAVKGVILDVIVDLRRSSASFGKYESVILSENNKRMLFVPRGMAHGFLVLSNEADVSYLVDNDYNPASEGGLVWNDPDLNIDWPISNPIINERDSKWPTLRELKGNGNLFD